MKKHRGGAQPVEPLWVESATGHIAQQEPYSDVDVVAADAQISSRRLISLLERRRIDGLYLENYGWVVRRSAVRMYRPRRIETLRWLKNTRADLWERLRALAAFVSAVFSRGGRHVPS